MEQIHFELTHEETESELGFFVLTIAAFLHSVCEQNSNGKRLGPGETNRPSQKAGIEMQDTNPADV
jgi:hypothetical protein